MEILNDFQYLVKYDYNTNYSCLEYGCRDEGICRCSKISNAKVEEIDLISITNHLYDKLIDIKSSRRNKRLNNILYGCDIDEYCLNRILTINKLWDKEIYEINICRGYYGQEVESITMQDSILRKIENEFEEVFLLDSLSDKIRYILTLENGYLLDIIKNVDFVFAEINKSDINIKNSDNYIKSIIKNKFHFYEDYPYLHGVLKEKSGKYKIIDGHHRILSSKDKILRVAFYSE